MGELSRHVKYILGDHVILDEEAKSFLEEKEIQYRKWVDGLITAGLLDLLHSGLLSEEDVRKYSVKTPKTVEVEKKPKLRVPRVSPIEEALHNKRLAYDSLIKFIGSAKLKQTLLAEIVDPDRTHISQYPLKMPRTLRKKIDQVVSTLNAEFGTDYSVNTFLVTVITLAVDWISEALEKRRNEIYQQYISEQRE